MLLIKKLYDLKFDFSILPADISKDIDLLRQLTKGTFEYQSQKIEILDNAIFDAIHALYYDDTSVREVFLMWMNDQQIFSNDGINTIVSDEVVEANLENPETYTIFVKDLTRDEIQHIISGTSKIGYATTIKAAADYLRISESADSEDSGSQNIKLNEAQRLNSFITENNLWFPKKDLGIFLERGAEQKVYFSDDKYIIKTNDCHFYNSWHDYFYSLLLHNYFFPDTTYELIGFIQDHNLLFSVVRQTFITEDRETDLKFVKKFMAANGFENTRNNDYYSPSLGIILADLPDLKLNAGGNIDTPDKSLEYLAMQKYIDKALDNLSRSSRTVNAIIDTSSSANKSEVIVSDSPTDIAIQAKENYTETLEYLYSVKNKKFTQFYGAEEVLEFVDDINKRINDGIVKDGILLRDEDSDKFPYTLVADLPEARNQFANEFYDRVNSSDAQKSAAWIHWRINFTDHFFADGCGKTADALAFFILTRHNSELPTFPANQSEWFAHASKKRRNPSNPRSYYDMSWLNWVFFYKSLFK